MARTNRHTLEYLGVRSYRSLWPLLAASALLAGCGGGGVGGGGTSAPGGTTNQEMAQLIVSNVAVSTTNLAPGGGLLIGETVENVGTADATRFRIGVYLSDDPTLDALDRYLGSRTLGSLTVGETSTGGGSFQVPIDVDPGEWWVLVAADDLDEVEEGDEGDNVARPADPVQVLVIPLPQLTPSLAINATPVVEAGQTITVTDTVTNSGDATAGSFRIGVYLSVDSVITTGDTLVGFRSVTTLDSLETDTAIGDLTVPLGTPAGVYQVGVLVDDLLQVGEADEADNMLIAPGGITVLSAPQAQIVVDSISFTPSTVDVGTNILVSDVVRNDGDVPSSAFVVGVYLSDDPVVTEDDRLLGIRTVVALAPAESSPVVDQPLPIPTDMLGGVYFVGAIADVGDAIPETDEVDNIAVSPGSLTVTVPPLPDIVPTGINASPNILQAASLEPIVFDVTVENQGVNAAGFFRIGLYLSSNPVIGAEDTLLDVRQVNSLNVGATTTFSGSTNLPAGLPPGTYFIGVRVDDLDSLDELSEGNNVLLAPGSIDVVTTPVPLADLETTLVALDDYSVEPGDTVILITRIENVGDLSASPFSTGIYLSLDDQVDVSDILIAEREQITGFGIGFASVVAGPIALPSDLAGGSYRLGCWADHTGVIVENEEDNNKFVALGQVVVTIPPPPAPDLVPEHFTFTGTTFTAGDVIPVNGTVINAGPLASGTFRIGVYLSDDDDVTTDDTFLGWRDVTGLGPALTNGSSWNVTLPADTAAGTWNMGTILDDLNMVSEMDETNNTLVSSTTLEVL
jgi:subtilase family serine protease